MRLLWSLGRVRGVVSGSFSWEHHEGPRELLLWKSHPEQGHQELPALSKCPQQTIICLEGELDGHVCPSHVHHGYWDPWAGVGECPVNSEAFETAIKPLYSLLLTAGLGVSGQAFVFNPCSFRCGCGTGACLDVSWEVCAAAWKYQEKRLVVGFAWSSLDSFLVWLNGKDATWIMDSSRYVGSLFNFTKLRCYQN